MRAAELFKAGRTQAEVSRELGVSRQSASRWHDEYQRGGSESLRGAGRAGRKPMLDEEQLLILDATLREGAEANGFDTNLWTLPRVALIIERTCGVRYHPGHVWKILGRLGWTLQRPAKQARERNQEKRNAWVTHRWPKIKKKPAAHARGSSSKTKAESPNDRRSVEPGLPRAKRRS